MVGGGYLKHVVGGVGDECVVGFCGDVSFQLSPFLPLRCDLDEHAFSQLTTFELGEAALCIVVVGDMSVNFLQ